MQPDHYLTILKNTKGEAIDITMWLPEDTGTKDTSKVGNLFQMLSKLNGGIMLRGAVYAKGGIESFYLKNDQKNLVALFFQLPVKPVKIGDSWEIGTNLISMDQNFKCDSAYKKNNVSVVAIDDVDNDNIVTVKYDIEEYVEGGLGFVSKIFGSEVDDKKIVMRMTYKATAKFSVSKGRWVSYNGEMETNNRGPLGGYSKTQFSLILQ